MRVGQGTAQRLERLRAALAEASLDGLIITDASNWHYFSGFTGDAGALLVAREQVVLVTDSRYVEVAGQEAPLARIVQHGASLEETLQREIAALGGGRWGFEADSLTVARRARLSDPEVELVPTEGIGAGLRSVKDAEEVAAIRHACAIADQALGEAFLRLQPGVREDELAFWLEQRMRELGAEGKGFGLIVASGPRGSLPHGAASDRVVQAGELVTFDIGCRVQGYHSDITRTFAVGRVPDELRRMHDIVLQAQLAGVARIRPGVLGREVDQAARGVIEAAGYGERFGHSTGHGVGLEVHEQPRISRLGDRALEPGMVITVEPGIYVPGLGGVRIEDTVLVTETGPEVLTPSPKELRTA